MQYELAFVGGACRYFREAVGEYQRYHDTLESAHEEAGRVYEILLADGTNAAHEPIICWHLHAVQGAFCSVSQTYSN